MANLAPCIGEVLGVRPVPIEYRAEGRRRSLSIAGLASMEIEAIAGQNGEEVTISNMPLCVAPGVPAAVAKSRHLSYQDYGFQWEITDRNGFYSPFAYQG
jgi:hypothetical protein